MAHDRRLGPDVSDLLRGDSEQIMAYQGANPLFVKAKTGRALVENRLELATDESATDAAAISVLTPITALVATGATDTRTLADGYNGQIKVLFYKTDTGGTLAVTPAHLYNGNIITFTDVNESWIGVFYAGQWHTIMGSAEVSSIS